MDWIHCNICFVQPSNGNLFSLTSCGHMYCYDCLKDGTQNSKCKVCDSECTSIKLVAEMKQDVREFFTEPDEILTKLITVLDFQKQHRTRLTEHWLTLNNKYNEAKMEVKRLSKIAEKMYGDLKELYKQNKMLKSALSSNQNDATSPFSISNEPIPVILSSKPGTASSVRGSTQRSQGFHSSLVTPMRINRMRGHQSQSGYGKSGAFCSQTPASHADTPDSGAFFSPRSGDSQHPYGYNNQNK